MNKNEKNLYDRVLAAFDKGQSLAINDEDRQAASALVKSSKCFWSLDTNRPMAYAPAHGES